MVKPKLIVAILGASGIGKFHFREFLRAGATVAAILGSSAETAEKTADALSLEFGPRPRAYADLDALLKTEHLRVASVCTPPEMHYDHVKKCLLAGLHVMCEKPFVLNSSADNLRGATELVLLAKERKRVLAVNTQWPSVMRYTESFVDVRNVKTFSMYLEPGSRGAQMLPESLPHMNSMLVKLLPGGRAERITFNISSEEEMSVDFDYRTHGSACSVHYEFKHKAERPRDVRFSINGVHFTRFVGEGYQQKLVTGKTEIDIEDPFTASIGMFVGAIEGRNSPLVSMEEIVENVRLQDEIIKKLLFSDT